MNLKRKKVFFKDGAQSIGFNIGEKQNDLLATNANERCSTGREDPELFGDQACRTKKEDALVVHLDGEGLGNVVPLFFPGGCKAA